MREHQRKMEREGVGDLKNIYIYIYIFNFLEGVGVNIEEVNKYDLIWFEGGFGRREFQELRVGMESDSDAEHDVYDC